MRHWTYRNILIVAVLALAHCAGLPEGKESPKAEEIADRMLQVVGFEKWQQTAAVEFAFREDHYYLWDRQRRLVEVKWSSWGDDIFVQFDKRSLRGLVRVDGELVTDHEDRKEYIQDAYKYFVNDSFWLNPLFHIRAQGSKRLLVDDNKLLVTFTSGGVTPGDSYEFTPDQDYQVKSMRMWVSILPFKGLSADFSGHAKTETGFGYSQNHEVGLLNVSISGVKAHASYPPEGTSDRFAELLKHLGS